MDKVIYLKAIMPEVSGYKIADIFNRKYQEKETVSKSFVYDIFRKHQYAILLERSNIKNKKPYSVAPNKVWGIDLTGKQDSKKTNHHIFAIVEHNSRANLALESIKNKTSLLLLKQIIKAIEVYGKPKAIRTDNDIVFTSKFFKFGMWLLNIQHQTIDPGCPWQNGRVERFFGTLKNKLNRIIINDSKHLQLHLTDFRFWYNHVRTHLNLDGKTPGEVWSNKSIKKQSFFYSQWGGLLQGYWHPT